MDLPERKRAEEEKEKLQAQLMQAQKMDSVGRLASGVAHDFNNMLTGILGYTELALIRCGAAEQPILSELKLIRDAGHRAANLVRQLLTFARKQDVAPVVLNVNDAVAGMIKMLLRIVGEDIDLRWMPKTGVWSVLMDPSQLDQILINLCVNARDAIVGAGKLSIATENVTFRESDPEALSGMRSGDFVRLVISDSGSGMSSAVRDRIFEPFFTTKKLGKGTGLGLATVYGIVQQNAGFINVHSEPERGSTFQIYFPRHRGAIKKKKKEQPRQSPRGHGELLLLVEDEPVILDMGRAMLEQLGYTVLIAGTPGEALRLVNAHGAGIRMLITDIVMPGMNGWELARMIAEIRPGVKCLYTSGYTANLADEHGVVCDMSNFLGKPFALDELATKVHHALHAPAGDGRKGLGQA